jgi:hypothetical protein
MSPSINNTDGLTVDPINYILRKICCNEIDIIQNLGGLH